MNRNAEPITAEQFPGFLPAYVRGVLAHFGVTTWGDLDGRCQCALEEAVSHRRVPALRALAATYGADIVTHDRHTYLADQLTLNPANTELQAHASRASCPLLYAEVPVPSELVSNWNQPEAHWWRTGVDAGRAAR